MVGLVFSRTFNLECFLEYLLEKYGAKFRPTEDGRIDDLYCVWSVRSDCFVYSSAYSYDTVTHYAEGSLMPVVINKLVFSHIPRQSPALLRPLVKSVFSAIEKKMLIPQLKAHCELVSRVIAPSMPTLHSYALTYVFYCVCARKIESHLKSSKTGWLAGCDHPTSADFMMGYGIETVLMATSGDIVGPKTKEYVKRIQER